MTDRTRKKWKRCAGILLLLGFVVAIVLLAPWFLSLRNASVRQEFQELILSKGALGVLIMLGIQVLQVVVAVLPGEAVELLAGAAYGTLWGLVVCLAGVLLGSVLIFYMVRAFGHGLVEWLFSREKLQRLSFLNNTKQLEVLTFFLFFIPGTPKDLLTYMVPLTKIRPRTFFFISTFARIPSIITSTYTGSILMEGQWWKAVAMFLLMGAVGLLGILIHNSIVEKKNDSNR